MKFMVELNLAPGSKNKSLALFEERGPNRNPGVALRGAWASARSDMVFALVESDEESFVAKAATSWTAPGNYKITPVHDIEQV
jgi:hypothetical protein